MIRTRKPTRRGLGAIALAAVLALVATRAQSSSTGPYPALSGVPAGEGVAAEQTCIACHASYALNADAGVRVALEGVPEVYSPGARYPLRFVVRADGVAANRWGFQLTAVDRARLHGAGAFTATDPRTTQVVEGGPAGRTYVEHAYLGTGIGETAGFAWSFEWTAPAEDVGAVAFYGSANAANADGSQNGDRIYNPTPAPLAVVAGPGGGRAAVADRGDGDRDGKIP